VATARQLDSRESALPIESTRRLVESRLGTAAYPDRHAIAVAACADQLAGQLALTIEVRRTVVEGALLHDVGKLLVDDSILEKPGPLTEAERQQINLHPLEGERIVRWSVDPGVADVVRTHHERWDGHGYPHGLAADEIPMAARVVAVADAYLAMLEERPYREPRTQSAALRELQDGSGTQFDPSCVAALVKLVAPAAPPR
jgi:HD-GYP domain-containing protein (c-di-GMP phosphodiesterase class II)